VVREFVALIREEMVSPRGDDMVFEALDTVKRGNLSRC